ncbi:MAG TPA: ATP-dependent helicase HrpB [Egicoccus sp.]|nr:ATP-dependent helicase HrpB [Egicoccus sp.]HSK22235.1 ATP-dependent helicase HrpB [Egicoccus sp.]
MSPPPLPGAPLPVDAVLDDVVAGLRSCGRVVLEAPPGAGKTTRVPLALLADGLDGRLVLLEPRRVAARAAARRLAAGLGEPVGATVGLTTRDERRTSRDTRIEVVTEGVLLRRLQRDPLLEGTGTLFFDEFHERNLESDLALAFAMETRATVRDDLRVLVASATLDGTRVAALLATTAGAPAVIRAAGRSHPVTVEHRDRPAPGQLAATVAATVLEGMAEREGDVLVFLPGTREIRRTERVLRGRVPATVEVRPLHGSLPPADQDRALAPPARGHRKVVLATDLAESSLTIDGVRIVVDAGLAREPRFDARTGMTGLVTVPASRAAAEQRAGRAGRTAPGHAVRLWPAAEHPSRDAFPRPAIRTDDLTGAALEVAAWGTPVEDLALLDQPDPAGWLRARTTLAELGALDDDGRISGHGRVLARLPVHPRLGHLLVRGHAVGLGEIAIEVAAVLADRDPLRVEPGVSIADIGVRLALLRGGALPRGARGRPGARERLRREMARLRRACRDLPPAAERGRIQDDDAVGALVALGWPDRVASARGGRGQFLLANGRGAQVPEHDLLAGEDLLAVAAVDRGDREARIHLAAPLDIEVLGRVLGDEVATVEEVAWRDGDVVAESRRQLGAIVLERRPLPDPSPDALLAAVVEGLRRHGLDLLPWTPAARQLQARAQLLHRHLGDPWPDVSDAAMLDDLDTAVAPFLLRVRRRADLRRVAPADIIRARLPAGHERDLDRLAPATVTVPSGSQVRVDYDGDRPVLAVRLQELFGATSTPAVLDGRLPLLVHLLSPARRPVQITDDLGGFWDRAYPQVRAELRGRYPKHAWPEDPRTAQPLRGTKRRR